MIGWWRDLAFRCRAAAARRAHDAVLADRDRHRTAQAAVRRAADSALDAARALDLGEWDAADELLGRARRDVRHARELVASAADWR